MTTMKRFASMSIDDDHTADHERSAREIVLQCEDLLVLIASYAAHLPTLLRSLCQVNKVFQKVVYTRRGVWPRQVDVYKHCKSWRMTGGSSEYFLSFRDQISTRWMEGAAKDSVIGLPWNIDPYVLPLIQAHKPKVIYS